MLVHTHTEPKKNESIFTLNRFLRQKFGTRVHKISIDAGFTCPNRDGKLGTGGCIFCNPESFSPSVRNSHLSVSEQVKKEVLKMKKRMKVDAFLAYFQPATNTHAPVHVLEQLYREALSSCSDIVGLVIGTRPDCVPDAVLDLLQTLNSSTWVHLELGLQSIHDKYLKWFERGHTFADFEDAVGRAKSRGLHVGAHLILGIPTETDDEVIETARVISSLGVDSVKIHNLYASTNTKLAQLVVDGEVELISKDEYIRRLIIFIEHVSPHCVIERLVSESLRDCLVAPQWCLDKNALLEHIIGVFEREHVQQGSKYRC